MTTLHHQHTAPPRLRVGIAGLGRRHAQALAFTTRHVSLVAACSPVPDELEHARHELGVERLYSQFEDLLADTEVDAVVLVTPTSQPATGWCAVMPAAWATPW